MDLYGLSCQETINRKNGISFGEDSNDARNGLRYEFIDITLKNAAESNKYVHNILLN